MNTAVLEALEKAEKKVRENGFLVTYGEAGFQLAQHLQDLHGDEIPSQRAFNDLATRATSKDKVFAWLKKYLPGLIDRVPQDSRRDEFLESFITELQKSPDTFPALSGIEVDLSNIETGGLRTITSC